MSRLRRLGLLSVLLLSGCATLTPEFKKPTVAVTDIRWLNGSLLQQHMLVALTVQNPNALAIPVNSLNVAFSVDDEPIGLGKATQAVSIPAHGQATVSVEVVMDLSRAVLKLLPKLRAGTEPLHYEAKGSLGTDVLWLKELPFDLKGEWQLQH
jgi:LEA14-like dessication related protein